MTFGLGGEDPPEPDTDAEAEAESAPDAETLTLSISVDTTELDAAIEEAEHLLETLEQIDELQSTVTDDHPTQSALERSLRNHGLGRYPGDSDE